MYKKFTHFLCTPPGYIHKFLLIMRLATVILMISLLQVSAATVAQNLTYAHKQTSITQIIKEIRKQTGLNVMASVDNLKNIPAIDVNFKNTPVADVLNTYLAGQPLTYEMDNKLILIKEKPASVLDKIKKALAIPVTVTGKVTDSLARPLVGATVTNKTTNATVLTGVDGGFTISAQVGDRITFSYIGFDVHSLTVTDGMAFQNVVLREGVSKLNEVVVSTGYQTIPQERATGSFEQIGHKLFDRAVGMNFTDHIKNLSSGVFFNNSPLTDETILIRGRSTIYANSAPLIVIDNFPYDGDISNINPNDIESVTILKDAAAASIWGARAGNGVIVITTKRGTTKKTTVSFNNAITIRQRPNIEGLKTISSADYIDLEKTLFAKGYYADDESNDQYDAGHPPFTPVIDLLRGVRDGTIAASVANTQIEAMKKYEAKKDIAKYLYRSSVLQQHSASISGNADKVNYYISTGWDKNIGNLNLVGNDLERVSLRTQESFKITSKFQVDAGLNFVKNNTNQGNNPGYNLNNGAGKALYPYARLVDDQGNPINLIENNNTAFVQRAMKAGLQDWTYNPINDISAVKNGSKITDVVANAGIKYNLFHGLDFEVKYQYENQQNNGAINYSSDSFYTRNLTNQFAQVTSSGAITYPIPLGAIVDNSDAALTSHQGRAQLNYQNTFSQKHQITAIAGWEIKDTRITSNSNRFYGFDKNSSTVNNYVDYNTQFVQYDNIYNYLNIPNYDAVGGTDNRYVSYYANASYIYNYKYIVSGSARHDGSNLFGVNVNQKGVPLWSTGLAWIINKESFYNSGWLPELKLRATYGLQGNVYTRASAYATATYGNSVATGLPDATLQNPPNANLRWERNATLNLGADFAFKNNIISGSIEYYQKRSKYLMAHTAVDPTSGIANVSGGTDFFGNVADMSSNGVDITINANLGKEKFKWSSTYIFSYANPKVTNYYMPTSPIGNNYVAANGINPVLGRSIYGIYSFKWAGLDPANGNPQGYLNNQISTNYGAILGQTSLNEMIYNGPAIPPMFGAWRNTFSYGNISLSVNISYKLGYYFRSPSVNYGSLFSSWTGSSDYALRWQKPGDEKLTNVPSMVYPADPNRDRLYTYSDALVLKGDHIRLEDISLSYNIDKSVLKSLPFDRIKVYGYASNLGLIWKENKKNFDPDYINYPNPGKSFALGVNLIF
jgi:TonB-linked SusC/RagA family outer membrane protein